MICPLVTAVIPTYNYARFLPRAIDSVLAQTYPSLECVVVDDGSTDATGSVLHRYGNRIRPVVQSNRGLSAARNTGIADARGEYIAFLDADDWWHPEKIERQVAMMETAPHVGCAGCGRQHVDANGAIIGEFRGQRSPGDIDATFRAIATRAFWVGGSGSGAMIRRDLLREAGGFDPTLRAAEDWDLWLRLSAMTAIDNVPEVLTSICRHGTGSFRNVLRMEQAQWTVYERMRSARPRRLSKVDLRRVRALILADAAGESVFAGDIANAFKYSIRSLASWPLSSPRWKVTARLAARHTRDLLMAGSSPRPAKAKGPGPS